MSCCAKCAQASPHVVAIAREVHDGEEYRLEQRAEHLGIKRWARTWDDLDDLQRHDLTGRAQDAWDLVSNANERMAA